MAFAPRRANPGLAKKRRALSTVKNEGKVVLERVLGLTCVNNNSLASTNQCIAYPAGCTIVLFYPKKNRQSHIINPSRKTVSCLCIASEKYLAYGESGHSPSVRICDISVNPPVEMAKLSGHTFGVTCVVFSPNLRYLVSAGYQHDQNIFVWNWKSNIKVATNKITTKVSGISFSEDGKYFVTVGSRRIRYWYFDTTIKDTKTKATLPLNGRSAILGDQRNKVFVAVNCGQGSFAKYTYAVTTCGSLFQLNENREVNKMLSVQTGQGYCIAITPSHVVVGCADGVIRLFNPLTLDYVISLPRPHCLGVKLSSANELFSEKGNSPDTVAMVYDDFSSKLVVIYNDHSLYTWDIKNLSQIGKAYSCLYHNACIWDISIYSPSINKDKPPLPLTSFITCSSDNTIRFWSLENGEFCFKNIYSKELIRIIYDIEDTKCLRDVSKLPGDCTAVSDATRGTRCIEIHPLGQHMATGDRQGNLKIYDLNFMDKIHDIMAHDSEILSITYSTYRENTNNDNIVQLVSCGADKSLMIQELITDTAGRLPSIKRVNHIVEKSTMYDMIIDPTLKTIATVGQDRLVRVYNASSCKQKLVYKGGASEEGSGLLKVTIDPSGLFIATSGSDKIVCLFEFLTGECITKLYGHSEVITALKFSSCCQYLYTASGDSCIFVWKLPNELTQRMHSHLADIGLLHKLPQNNSNSNSFRARKETYCVSPSSAVVTISSSGVEDDSNNNNEEDTDNIDEEIIDDNEFDLNQQLPAWAQKSCGIEIVPTQSHDDHVTGKWAERLDDDMKILTTESFSEIIEEESDQTVLEFGKIQMEELPRYEIEDPLQDEEEVVYPVCGRDSVDPSMFKVSTPERRLSVSQTLESSNHNNKPDIVINECDSNDEEELEDDYEQHETPNEEMFLKTNFEILTSADEIFQLYESGHHYLLSPGRPSISTMYLSKSKSRIGCLLPSTTPVPIDMTTPPSIELPMTAQTDSENSIDVTTPPIVHSHEHGNCEGSNKTTIISTADKDVFCSDNETTTLSSDSHVTATSGEIQSRPRLLTSVNKITKSKITTEEISKARKRLEELGYSDEYIRGSKRRKQETTPDNYHKDTMADSGHDSPNKENMINGGGNREGMKGDHHKQEDSGSPQLVLDQINGIETNIKTLRTTVEQMMPISSELLLKECTSAITLIRQHCVRMEQIVQEKAKLFKESSCGIVTDEQSPRQSYLSPDQDITCTTHETDPLLVGDKEGSITLQHECALEDSLELQMTNSTQNVCVTDTGTEARVNSVVVLDNSQKDMVNESNNVPVDIDSVVVTLLDPAIIKPLLDSYSQQLVEAVKLKLSTIN